MSTSRVRCMLLTDPEQRNCNLFHCRLNIQYIRGKCTSASPAAPVHRTVKLWLPARTLSREHTFFYGNTSHTSIKTSCLADRSSFSCLCCMFSTTPRHRERPNGKFSRGGGDLIVRQQKLDIGFLESVLKKCQKETLCCSKLF